MRQRKAALVTRSPTQVNVGITSGSPESPGQCLPPTDGGGVGIPPPDRLGSGGGVHVPGIPGVGVVNLIARIPPVSTRGPLPGPPPAHRRPLPVNALARSSSPSNSQNLSDPILHSLPHPH